MGWLSSGGYLARRKQVNADGLRTSWISKLRRTLTEFSVAAPLAAVTTSSEPLTSACCSRSSAFSDDDPEHITDAKTAAFTQQFPSCTGSKVTLRCLSADGDAVLFAALPDVLHQDLHQHSQVFLTQSHLKDTARRSCCTLGIFPPQHKCDTYLQRPQDSLDLHSRDAVEPGSSQVPCDQQLQVDWLEDVRLDGVWFQRGSETTRSRCEE